MKLIRNILFFTAAIIMVGHDIVPHNDLAENKENAISQESIIASQHIDQKHSELGHIFEHFQHSSNERAFEYANGIEKNLNVKIQLLQNSAAIIDIDDQFIWYSNFEKQRFRDYPLIPYFSTLSSHTLRGPPIS
ncbi:hypothetical protein [Christiangramia forsetii]|uniref:Uncharacterized protein n=2 Tax=Christiangramia forsetii TaxID=411153 RepID=A0M0X2_CHRFK|nr:hypothetical protein [Christiangramia forsetii]CAL66267.1 hypothetical protein GFO_1293 [Christiangramia forsetii KT0803]